MPLAVCTCPQSRMHETTYRWVVLKWLKCYTDFTVVGLVFATKQTILLMPINSCPLMEFPSIKLLQSSFPIKPNHGEWEVVSHLNWYEKFLIIRISYSQPNLRVLTFWTDNKPIWPVGGSNLSPYSPYSLPFHSLFLVFPYFSYFLSSDHFLFYCLNSYSPLGPGCVTETQIDDMSMVLKNISGWVNTHVALQRLLFILRGCRASWNTGKRSLFRKCSLHRNHKCSAIPSVGMISIACAIKINGACIHPVRFSVCMWT